MLKNFFTFSRFTLFIALCISAIAAWYSVIGLTAIFAGAVLPIIIMGGILEVAKITTTVWLHRYWNRAGYAIRTYLTVAVVALACLTSMGIFGLLSKAHLEQNVVSGDVVGQISLFDEKIKTQRDNIELARKALGQMDAQVDQRLARGDTEAGAERAVQIRRQQGTERSRLQKEIADAQKEIQKLNEQRAPIASQLRKVEAEVGPVKYIAALIYGDNPDITTLERAVRWVIILIVVVFDPLAIVLILAANNSLKWDAEPKEQPKIGDDVAAMGIVPPPEEITRPFTKEEVDAIDSTHMTPWPTEWKTWDDDSIQAVAEETLDEITDIEEKLRNQYHENQKSGKDVNFSQGDYKTTYTASPFRVEPMATSTPAQEQPLNVDTAQEQLPVRDEGFLTEVPASTDNLAPRIQVEGVTKEIELYSSDNEYVIHDGKTISIQALRELKPGLVVNGPIVNDILFGGKFPTTAKRGDLYTRTDTLPHKTYKFNGSKWIDVDRTQNTTYLQNIAYIQYLISKIDSGEYDPELLTDIEQDEISSYLKSTQ